MKKAFYVLIVIVVLLGMLPVSTSAKKGTGMYVSAISGWSWFSVTGYRYHVEVMVVDENGHRVFGARVIAKTNIGTDKVVSALTDDLGVAMFNVYTDQAYFHLAVDNVVKPSYIYLPELNLESDIDLIAPPSP